MDVFGCLLVLLGSVVVASKESKKQPRMVESLQAFPRDAPQASKLNYLPDLRFFCLLNERKLEWSERMLVADGAFYSVIIGR